MAAVTAGAVSQREAATEDLNAYMLGLGAHARAAAETLAGAPTEAKNAALAAIADSIGGRTEAIKSANRRDLDAGRSGGLAAPLLDRLELTDARIRVDGRGAASDRGAAGPRRRDHRPADAALGPADRSDAGAAGRDWNHLRVTAQRHRRRRGPVHEVRQRDHPARRFRSTCLEPRHRRVHPRRARGGRSPAATRCRWWRRAIALRSGCSSPWTRTVDVIVPRGGRGLIERIGRDARVPVIKHLDGNCHVFIDEHADLDMAITVAVNAKTYRYGICGAMETLLVDRAVAPRVLPALAGRFAEAGVEIRGCEETRGLVDDAVAATEEDWETEYLAPILAVRVVGRRRRGDGAHRPLRLGPHRRHRDRRPRRARDGSWPRSTPARSW